MERQWKGNTKGTPWMHRMLIASFKVMNLRFIYAGLAVAVVPCCMLLGTKATWPSTATSGNEWATTG